MNQIQKITNLADALESLGVSEHTLTSEEKRDLDELGFVIFHDFIDPEWLGQLRETYEQLMEKEGANAGKEFRQEKGTRRLSDLINKGEVFDRIYIHPKMLAVAHYVIGRDFKVNTINGRDALPGEGHQALHADWGHASKVRAITLLIRYGFWMISHRITVLLASFRKHTSFMENQLTTLRI